MAGDEILVVWHGGRPRVVRRATHSSHRRRSPSVYGTREELDHGRQSPCSSRASPFHFAEHHRENTLENIPDAGNDLNGTRLCAPRHLGCDGLPQKSIDYTTSITTASSVAEVGEVPFSAIWTCRASFSGGRTRRPSC